MAEPSLLSRGVFVCAVPANAWIAFLADTGLDFVVDGVARQHFGRRIALEVSQDGSVLLVVSRSASPARCRIATRHSSASTKHCAVAANATTTTNPAWWAVTLAPERHGPADHTRRAGDGQIGRRRRRIAETRLHASRRQTAEEHSLVSRGR